MLLLSDHVLINSSECHELSIVHRMADSYRYCSAGAGGSGGSGVAGGKGVG